MSWGDRTGPASGPARAYLLYSTFESLESLHGLHFKSCYSVFASGFARHPVTLLTV